MRSGPREGDPDSEGGVRSDQKEPFVWLYVETQQALHAWIGTFFPNLADVDEVFQETSIVLWRKFDQFDCDQTDLNRRFLRWAVAR